MSAFESQFFVVECSKGVIRVTRSATPFASLSQMQLEFDRLNDHLDRLGRRWASVLVDTRAAPPRNDPAFEEAFEPLRRRMLGGFRRSAVLISSPIGKLQVERHVRLDGLDARVFSDLEAASAYCAGSG